MRRWAKAEIALLILIGITPAEFNWYYNPRLAHLPRLFWSVDVTRFVVLPTLLVGWGLYRRLFSLADIGLHTRILGRREPALFAVALVLVPLLLCWAEPRIVAWTATVIPPRTDQPHFDYTQVLPPRGPETGLYRLLAIAYMSLSAAATEELYFRGVFRRLFPRRWLWSIPFVILSSAAFASIHWYGGPRKVLYAFCVGLMTAGAYALTGNLWPLILAHFLIDAGWLLSAE